MRGKGVSAEERVSQTHVSLIANLEAVGVPKWLASSSVVLASLLLGSSFLHLQTQTLCAWRKKERGAWQVGSESSLAKIFRCDACGQGGIGLWLLVALLHKFSGWILSL